MLLKFLFFVVEYTLKLPKAFKEVTAKRPILAKGDY